VKEMLDIWSNLRDSLHTGKHASMAAGAQACRGRGFPLARSPAYLGKLARATRHTA